MKSNKNKKQKMQALVWGSNQALLHLTFQWPAP